MEWNEEQRLAIESRTNHMVVVASAGAGKTEVIVQKYLKYVTEHGVSPTQILALTYTNRAAANMKRRICKELRNNQLYNEAQLAETGPIQTLHSFYERILRENSIWTGMDPDFEILSDYESNRIWDLSLRSALKPGKDDRPEIVAYRQYISAKRRFRSQLDLDSSMRDQVIGTVIFRARNQNWTWERLRESFLNPERISSAFDSYIQDDLWPRSAHESLGAKSLAYRKNPKGMATGHELDREVDLFIGLVQLAANTWEIYNFEMTNRNKMDFSMLESSAVELLKKDSRIVNRVRQQIKVILLDESQDANANQLRFLEILKPENSLFVGDQKQSIYAFRGAMVEEFEKYQAEETIRLKLNYRSRPGIINFVNHVFQSKWKHQYDSMTSPQESECVSTDFTGVEILNGQNAPARQTALFIKQMVESGVPLKDITVLSSRHASLTKIKSHLQYLGIACEAMGGNESIFTKMEARDMANLLASCVSPTHDYYLACLLRSPYVDLSLDAIVMLGQQENIFNQLDTFVSPVGSDQQKISDFLSWFKDIRQFCDRYSAYEIINRAFAKSAYFTNLGRNIGGEQNIANARKLLVIATKNPELTPLQLADRFRHLQSIKVSEPLAPLHDPDANIVRLMTIHGSKGLEFKNVILYGHDIRASNADKIVCDFKRGMAFSTLKSKNIVHKEIATQLGVADLEERMRLLYVACTRAEEKLVIATDLSKSSIVTNQLLKSIPPRDYKKHNLVYHYETQLVE